MEFDKIALCLAAYVGIEFFKTKKIISSLWAMIQDDLKC